MSLRLLMLHALLVAGLPATALAQGAEPASAAPALWEVVPVPELKGETGRLVLEPLEANNLELRVYRAGEETPTHQRYVVPSRGYSVRLMPGSYDVRLPHANAPWLIEGVPIRRGHETRLALGVLNADLPSLDWRIYDEDEERWVAQGYSASRVVLPAGKWVVAYGDEKVPVTIEPGEAAEL